jgi:hypothetical protein
MGESSIGSTGKMYYRDRELKYGIGGNTQLELSIGSAKLIPTSIQVQAAGDMKEIRDNTGTICSIVIPEVTQQLSITGYLTGAGEVNKGEEVGGVDDIVDGIKSGMKWRVMDCSTNWQNEAVTNVTITVKGYDF